MIRTDLAGLVLLVHLIVGSLIWAAVGDWEYPDFSGAEFGFVDPTCDEVPQLCGTPVAVK